MINKGVGIITTVPSYREKLKESEKTTKDIAALEYDTHQMNKDGRDLADHADEFVNSFVNHYKNAKTVEDLIRAIEEDIADKDFEKSLYSLYVDVVIAAIFGNPVPTLILAGSSTYFEYVKNLADKAALAKVKYSTNMRITLRQYYDWGYY